MAGQKWTSVCQSVDNFSRQLSENDLIAAMLFNHEVKLLAKMDPRDELFQGGPR